MNAMSHGGMPPSGRGHAVSFYALDTEGIDAVASFVATGWVTDECVVVVATDGHRAAIDARLREQGHDPAAQLAHGRYLPLDADSTLRTFFAHGELDVARLTSVVGEALERAGAAGRPVRVFGEMVALLWARGQVEAAIELELQWNHLLLDHEFSLLCSYPTGAFDKAELVDVRRICDLHTDLVQTGAGDDTTTALRSAGHACSRVYLPTPESVPAARHFVVDVLRSWGHDALAADAALIVSELATNALSHADSPFRTVVDRRRGVGVGRGRRRLAVGDGRARRWVAPPTTGFATTLLLVARETLS